MPHFAIFCPEAAGHLFPMGCLGQELRRRGHEVTLVARPKAAAMAQRLDLPLYELPLDDAPPFRPPTSIEKTVAFLLRTRQLFAIRRRLSYRSELLLELAPRAIKELGVDGLVVDQDCAGAASVAEHLGIPYLTACSSFHWLPEDDVPPHFTRWRYAETPRARFRNRLGYRFWDWYTRPVVRVLNRYRAAWKLPPLRGLMDTFSPLAQLGQTCPEFDFPRRELPDVFHYVGGLAADRQEGDDPFPWDRLEGRRLIYASLGTVRTGANLAILRKIVVACADLDAQLVLSTGKWEEEAGFDPNRLKDLPGNAIVTEFVPQLAMLEKANLLITHAGQNTVVEALTRAVPMVALPRSADQPAIATRIEYSGVGLWKPFFSFTPQGLRQMCERVLGETSFQQRAQFLQQAMAATGGVGRAAEIAEQALTTGRPVVRKDALT
jgi:MGT family glycosyltransferase